ncbi:hypothetical protein [Pyrococcus kukulkanii]|uniref:Uncharacterized protein n=1 Tax=Pyrococcus kukulkanii TaxID=1609559 RepID=A0ABV4T5M5_9EURY
MSGGVISLFEEWSGKIERVGQIRGVLLDFPGEIMNAVVLANLATIATDDEAKAITVRPLGTTFLLEGEPVAEVVNRFGDKIEDTINRMLNERKREKELKERARKGDEEAKKKLEELRKQMLKPPLVAAIEPTTSTGSKISENEFLKEFKKALAYNTLQDLRTFAVGPNSKNGLVGPFGKNLLYAFYPVPTTQKLLLDVKKFMEELAKSLSKSMFWKVVLAKFGNNDKRVGESETLLEVLGEAMKIFIGAWLPHSDAWTADWELILVLPTEGVSLSNNFNYSIFRMQLPLYAKLIEIGTKLTLSRSKHDFLKLDKKLPKEISDKVRRHLNLYIATGDITHLAVAMMEKYYFYRELSKKKTKKTSQNSEKATKGERKAQTTLTAFLGRGNK